MTIQSYLNGNKNSKVAIRWASRLPIATPANSPAEWGFYCMSRKKWPILYSNFLHKMDHYFLDRRYLAFLPSSNQQTKFTTKKCRFVLPNTNSVYCFKMSYKSVLHKNRFANVHLKHSCQSKSSFLHIWNQFSIQKLYILVYTSSYFYQIRNKLWSSKFCKCWYLFLFAVSFFIQSDKSA